LACLAAALASSLPGRAVAAGPFADWRHSGSLYILTTPAGADLPAGASVEQFPLLVRLHGDTFDFSQAAADGADLRFSAADGTPLAHEIESWDATRGAAAVWVRVPRIEGNAVQELRLHWGNPAAASRTARPCSMPPTAT
jgi:biopolymer transport protein ExbB